ncbi:DUF4259 domain-containing protein [uncultured Hyphomonas sp.]|uniref:DUF4259 domain-containing protein n=1 Tax=uncultured Hyphomonas sp. TaxID=225298 RepID=UPI002AABB47A|nr:DUF4259 domain-containing protein [uncultured Hyphomonas sp.]
MGAWGIGNFENDDAADFVYDVEEDGVGAIRRAIEAAGTEHADGYIEAPTAACLIAAGEFMAVALGKPAPTLSEDVVAAAKRLAIQPEMVSKALPLLASILEEGELKELWDESGNAAEWRQHVMTLIERLK